MAIRHLFFAIVVVLFLSAQAGVPLKHAVEAQYASGQTEAALGELTGRVSSRAFIKYVLRQTHCCYRMGGRLLRMWLLKESRILSC